MSWRLYVQTLRWQRVRLIVVLLAGIGWGFLMPTIYASFNELIREMANSGAIPEQFTNFGPGCAWYAAAADRLGGARSRRYPRGYEAQERQG